MADLALGGLDRIVKAGLAIKKAVRTVQQNKEACRDIQRCVDRSTALLSWLKELAMGVHHPSFTGPLDDLAESMEEALELITGCQQSNALRRLLGAGDMARQLRRVQDDIQRKLLTVILATSILNLQVRVSVASTLEYVAGAHPPFLLPQDAGRLVSDTSHSTAAGIWSNISGSSGDIATLTGGCEGPYPSSSTTGTGAVLFEQNTAQHFSVENVAGGRHCYALEQKIVIRLGMPSDRSRSRAMQLSSGIVGVSAIGITGNNKDRLEVVGSGVDAICLIRLLRKNIGLADIDLVQWADPRFIESLG